MQTSSNIDDPVRLDTRLAGQVKRFHTWPIIGQQSIAEHSWHILRIYLSVAQRPDPHFMMYTVFHDIGEHFTGDIPYPVKHDNPQLKEQMDMMEMRSYATQLDYWSSFHQCLLNEADRALFKQIELVEMAEFGMDQVVLGNSHGFIVAQRCLEAVYKSLPPPRLAAYVVKRIKLFFEQCPAVHIAHDLEEDWWFPIKWEQIHGEHESSNVLAEHLQ